MFKTTLLILFLGEACNLMLLVSSQVSLGKFVYNGHGLQGEVVVLNERQYRIKGFSYDGKGPAVWHTGMRRGSVGVYSERAYPFRNENNNCQRLGRRYSNKDVVITLPSNMSISRDVETIAVYCYRFCHNFGHVKVPRGLKVPPAPSNLGRSGLCKPNYRGCTKDGTKDNGVCMDSKSGIEETCPLSSSASEPVPKRSLPPPRSRSGSGSRSSTPRTIGRLYSQANGVVGEVSILNDKQFRIKGFSYSGARGSSTYFLIMEKGVTGIFSVKGFAVPDENGRCDGLRSYRNENVVITVPNNLSISRDIGAIAVYDYQNCSNFGHLALPDDLDLPTAGRGVPSGRKECLPYFRPCSRRVTTNPAVCKTKSGREFTC